MSSKMLVGWSQKNITPLKPSLLAGQFYERAAESVHDPITATALALESVDKNGTASEQAIMISCDLLLVEKHLQEGVRQQLKETLPDFDSKKLLVFATHVHTGPFTSIDELAKFGGDLLKYPAKKEGYITPTEYSEFLIGRLCEAAAEAWSERKPGGVSSELGFAVVGYNRMVTYEDGTARMYGQTDEIDFESFGGTTDHGVEILYLWDESNELTGLAINVACPSQIVEQKKYISADFWGEVRKELSKRYSKDLFVLAMTGAAGDQSPRDLTRRSTSFKEMNSEAGMAVIAERIANAVDSTITSAKSKIKSNADFKHRVCDIDLPVRKVTYADVKQAQLEYDKIIKEQKLNSRNKKKDENSDGDDLFHLVLYDGILARYRRQQDNPFYTMELHVMRIGDIAIATNPFELFLDYGLQIKARSKARQAFIIELACDCGLYLPTARAVQGGGYSTYICNGFVGPEGGRLLVDHTVRLINELMKKDVTPETTGKKRRSV